MLQIAPGDRVDVSYDDARAISGPKALAADLNAAFYNGSITLAYEEIIDHPGHGRSTKYFPARRCRVGDQLMVIVDDHDCDTTDDRDTVDVTITTSSGEKLRSRPWKPTPWAVPCSITTPASSWRRLKSATKPARDQIKVQPGDAITVSYLDKENTDPGVPIERSYTVMEAGEGIAKGLIYRTSVKQVEDTSDQAQAQKGRIKARLGWAPTILKNLVVARHPDYQPQGTAAAAEKNEKKEPGGKKDEEVVVAIGAPLLFEITCPKNALNLASKMYVTAVTESEIKAAGQEGKEPASLKVPLQIVPIDYLALSKGMPIQLQSASRPEAKEMLSEGVFSGIVRFELGKRGDPVNDLVSRGEESLGLALPRDDDAAQSNRVPTLRVAGGDVVYLKYQDPQTKQTAQWKVTFFPTAGWN